MSDHNEIWDDPRITAHAMGELSGSELQAFEREIAENGDLAKAVEQAREIAARLKQLYASEDPPPKLNDAARAAILAEPNLAEPNDAPETSLAAKMIFGSRRKRIIGLVSLAACGLVAVMMLPRWANRQLAMVVGTAQSVRSGETESASKTEIESLDASEGRYFEPRAMTKQTVTKKQTVTESDTAVSAPREPGPRGDLSDPTVTKGGMLGGMMMDDIDTRPDGVASNRAVPLLSKSPYGAGVPVRTRGRLPEIRTPDLGMSSGGMLMGPGMAGDRFDKIDENPFKRVGEHPLSTFSVDVDTASYSKVRSYLTDRNRWPRPDAVRIEELVNYFDYDYVRPDADAQHPFAVDVALSTCPWNEQHRLARVAIAGKTIESGDRPPCNLVFLIDTSGSMKRPNKLPMVISGLKMLTRQLNANDRVAIVVYAGSAGLVLDSTPASDKASIRGALSALQAGGSTNGGQGIRLAYQTARDAFVDGGVNRVILCSDGDFNVGTTGTDELVRLVERESEGGIFLSVLGFGMGNHNDAMLEQISGRGNGNYAFIDTRNEARKVLARETDATLVTIAKDVKLQIEFNPVKIAAYRLIGYENRVLAKEDFNDDKKDAGEIGAGHTVTALYELVPAGVRPPGPPPVDELRYQSNDSEGSSDTEPADTEPADAPEDPDGDQADEWMLVKLRYKQPDGSVSTRLDVPVSSPVTDFEEAGRDVRFAAAVASFGMQLRRSEHAGDWTLEDVIDIADGAIGPDRFGLRSEFVELAETAADLAE